MLVLPATLAAAQDFPSRPLRIIVPFPPGAITDTTSRMLATEIGKVIGQTVVVENKPGAGTLIGTQFTKSAPADGYTVLFQLNSLVTNTYLQKQPGYTLADFTPVAMLGESAYAIITSKRFASLQDLVAFAKANPGQLNCSGTDDRATTVVFSKLKEVTGIDWTYVNYKGGAEAVQAVMAGDVHFSILTQSAPLIFANPDKLTVVATTASKRAEFLPDSPTLVELGYPTMDVPVWFGLFARSDTPPAVLAKLKSVMAEVLRSPATQEQLRKLKITLIDRRPLDDVPAALQRELVDFTAAAKKLGVEPQ